MTITDLIIELKKIEDRGHGKRDVLLDCCNGDEYSIDSVQMNTSPDVEPDYYFLMKGGINEKV